MGVLDLKLVDDFGAIDADADELLRDCFQDHEAYSRARENKSFLVLGRKGSGKTAIYKRFLTEKAYDRFAYGHSFDDYPWHHHDLQAQTGVPEERRYIHSWKYLILMSLSKIVLNQDQSQPWSEEAFEALVPLEDFVVDSYGSRDPDVRQLFSPDKELKFKSTLRLPVLHVTGERIRVRELPQHVQEVNRVIQDHILRALNPNHYYYVCFDQLDLGFTTTQPEYAQRLVGLILAARDLFVAAKSQGKKLNVVVFLRDDIYQDLQFEDKNKVTENYTSRVQWRDYGEGLTLRQLMESRFAAVLGAGGRGVPWADVFDEEREMPSRQSKYKHICDRTFLRPRDVIKFCNEILKVYRQQGSSSGGRFDNSCVHLARDAYSDYLLSELDDEIAKHVPGYKDYLEVLKSVGTERFSMNDFVVKWRARYSDDVRDPMNALERLFEFSVVGYLKPGGRGGGSEYVWRYQDPRARFDSTAETFRVHPGFKEALDLSRASS
ncbi:P-loop ATPase, Sll1717 family [Micromonospora sp. URMC 107]|uniref:P-loop ATPase, Sll1717 family n=1 Tax=Micromonospora sp. URMC 107 TaxID=3423418 RepID=UPI003F1B8EEA